MPISNWSRSPRIRRGLAASIVVVAAGGLVLFRADAKVPPTPYTTPLSNGPNTASFAGPGVHGTLTLSHPKVLAGTDQKLFAELDVTADQAKNAAERAPLSIAVVLDTSGSMSGEKITEAKNSVVRLVEGMRDDDEIAFVRYSSDAELVQPLARVGQVRGALIERIQSVEAGGGTAIPRGLATGLAALQEASNGRVRRVILVSDGLDGTRAESEKLATDSFERGIIVSSMGIGLDFDESYMGSVAHAGHGNFAFVKDASSLASFMTRELKETATTTVENATVRLKLPPGVRFASAIGADANALGLSNEIELKIGSLFAGDERRILLELATTLEAGETRAIDGDASWRTVGGSLQTVHVPGLPLVATTDVASVDSSRDGKVLASATSVFSSRRQLEAAQAYERGDTKVADGLIQQSLRELKMAAAAAPAPAASALQRQASEYMATKAGFATVAPSSEAGKALPKAAAAKDLANMSRGAF